MQFENSDAKSILRLDKVSKTYGSNSRQVIKALEALSVEICEGQFVAVLGPSGCGKSTFLRLVAGLEVITSGDMKFKDLAITGPSRERSLVFQAYGSFPWMTVQQNVEFGLKHSGIPQEQRTAEAQAILELVDIAEFAASLPHTLSGGMQQRLALARCLALKPDMLLLDEPFASVDAINRKHLQATVRRIVNAVGSTTILVTHDVEEAILLADRILVMTDRPGRIGMECTNPMLSLLPDDRVRESTEFQALRRELTGVLDNHNGRR